MTEPPTTSRGFPFLTATGALLILFLFAGLMAWQYQEPSPLAEPDYKTETRFDPAAHLAELPGKNQAILAGKPGSGAKMSVPAATEELLKKLTGPKDTLPFPVPEPVASDKKPK